MEKFILEFTLAGGMGSITKTYDSYKEAISDAMQLEANFEKSTWTIEAKEEPYVQ